MKILDNLVAPLGRRIGSMIAGGMGSVMAIAPEQAVTVENVSITIVALCYDLAVSNYERWRRDVKAGR